MIAFVQPWSIYKSGGGPRILRSLLRNAPAPYRSIYASPFPNPEPNKRNEIRIPRRPYFGSLLEWLNQHVGNPLEYLTLASSRWFERRLRKTLIAHKVQAVHSIPQGIEYWYTFRVARELGLSFYFNVHDDLSYNLRNFPLKDRAMQHLGPVWREANGRIVISEAMGEEYNRRYGERPYIVVTDGLTNIATQPRPTPPNHRHVYFMGSIHISYENNFQTLLHALRRLRNDGCDVSLTVRGGIPFEFNPGSVPFHQLPWGSQEDVRADLKSADLLYFPLPFEPQFESFVRFSLSTKLVTYAGSGVPILFHGPRHSAAGQLLAKHDACLMADSPATKTLADLITTPTDRSAVVAQNALNLARTRFRIEDQRSKFWSLLLGTATVSSGPLS